MIYAINTSYQQCRGVVPGGAGGAMHPQILADQSIPRGREAAYAHHIKLAPLDFQTLLRPCNSSFNCTLQLWKMLCIDDYKGSISFQ